VNVAEPFTEREERLLAALIVAWAELEQLDDPENAGWAGSATCHRCDKPVNVERIHVMPNVLRLLKEVMEEVDRDRLVSGDCSADYQWAEPMFRGALGQPATTSGWSRPTTRSASTSTGLRSDTCWGVRATTRRVTPSSPTPSNARTQSLRAL
jgi:hypothetical protein